MGASSSSLQVEGDYGCLAVGIVIQARLIRNRNPVIFSDRNARFEAALDRAQHECRENDRFPFNNVLMHRVHNACTRRVGASQRQFGRGKVKVVTLQPGRGTKTCVG